jgi:hypothetical protein
MIAVISKVESYDIFRDEVKQSIQSALYPGGMGWLHDCRPDRTLRYFAFPREIE